jgi:hypothetical protein
MSFIELLAGFLLMMVCRFIYTLYLMIDANFRLVNLHRSSEIADPGLHTGLAYFVPTAPYLEYLKSRAGEKDVSISDGCRRLLLTGFADCWLQRV